MFAWIPCLGVLTIPLSGIGLLCGLAGLVLYLSCRDNGVGLAVAGTVLSFLAHCHRQYLGGFPEGTFWLLKRAFHKSAENEDYERRTAAAPRAAPVQPEALPLRSDQARIQGTWLWQLGEMDVPETWTFKIDKLVMESPVKSLVPGSENGNKYRFELNENVSPKQINVYAEAEATLVQAGVYSMSDNDTLLTINITIGGNKSRPRSLDERVDWALIRVFARQFFVSEPGQNARRQLEDVKRLAEQARLDAAEKTRREAAENALKALVSARRSFEAARVAGEANHHQVAKLEAQRAVNRLEEIMRTAPDAAEKAAAKELLAEAKTFLDAEESLAKLQHDAEERLVKMEKEAGKKLAAAKEIFKEGTKARLKGNRPDAEDFFRKAKERALQVIGEYPGTEGGADAKKLLAEIGKYITD